MSGKGTAISRYRSQRTADPTGTFFKDDKCGNVEAAGMKHIYIVSNKKDGTLKEWDSVFFLIYKIYIIFFTLPRWIKDVRS